MIIVSIGVQAFPTSSEFVDNTNLYYLASMAGEYFLYGSMVFGIYWGVRRFIHNKGLAIITALIPIIILRLVVAAMTGFIVRPI